MTFWTVLRIASIIAIGYGAWASFKRMGAPVIHDGRRYYRQPDGSYRRWYGGRGRSPEEVGAPGEF